FRALASIIASHNPLQDQPLQTAPPTRLSHPALASLLRRVQTCIHRIRLCGSCCLAWPSSYRNNKSRGQWVDCQAAAGVPFLPSTILSPTGPLRLCEMNLKFLCTRRTLGNCYYLSD